ncbi:MAG TPA: MBL fold metallo-hydrolase [Spirochaetota bacterium]|nr:MBL fold metallo-hydrolase [Spirochaetota bacterium]HPI89344.1 MBL fold metallo-hydrolase [Spirochaetota bacterium]HPR48310.1 MBL fold metallo-hydrolase [Spirochaetota bacterium]
MKTKITILCENTAQIPFPVIAEHGLSMLVEQDDVTLFDTGQGMALMHNMKVLGKNPESVDRVVLSHGHYDHTGGLSAFLQSRGRQTDVHLHAEAFNPRFAVVPLGDGKIFERNIGMPLARDEYENNGALFHETAGQTRITDNIVFATDIPHAEGWTSFDIRLKQKIGSEYIDDPFRDDGSLLLDTDSGPVVLLGCAHSGICEILDSLAEKNGLDRFHAVIGGSHLGAAPPEYINQAIDTLKKYRVSKACLVHCTGPAAACRAATGLGDIFQFGATGTSFEF